MVEVYPVAKWTVLSAMCFISPVILTVIVRLYYSDSKYYQHVDEFICTILWLLWSFVIYTITMYTNALLHSVLLFIALNISPHIFRGASVNPGVVVMKFLQQRLSLQSLFQLILTQLLAIPAVITIVWCTLSIVSLPQDRYTESNYLHVSTFEGFICEAVCSIVMFVPMAMLPQGLVTNFISASVIILLELVFGSMSGAFCNPLIITTWALFYNKHTWIEIIIAYWCGNFTGTLLSWTLMFN